MDTILIEKTKYIYRGNIYGDDEVENLRKKIGKRIKLVILGENPLIKICNEVKKQTSKAIEENIIANLIIDEDTLVDYDYDKRLKKLYIYSIKQGIKAKKILWKADKITVEPFQYIMRDIIKSKFKFENSYKAIMGYNDYLYFIEVDNKRLISTTTIEFSNTNLYKIVNDKLVGGILLVDLSLEEKLVDCDLFKSINFINLKEKINYEI